MPKLDSYGSQPPIELLRQFQDFRGFYDREKFFWKEIQVSRCQGFGLAKLNSKKKKLFRNVMVVKLSFIRQNCYVSGSHATVIMQSVQTTWKSEVRLQFQLRSRWTYPSTLKFISRSSFSMRVEIWISRMLLRIFR